MVHIHLFGKYILNAIVPYTNNYWSGFCDNTVKRSVSCEDMTRVVLNES